MLVRYRSIHELKLLFTVLFTTVLSQLALALTTKTWTGSTSSDFNTSGNWSPTGVPSSSDSCVISVGTTTTISLSGNITVGALYLIQTAANSTLTFNCNSYLLTVQGNYHCKATNSTASAVYLNLASSSGGLTIGRHAFIDDGGNSYSYTYANTSSPGKLTLKGNLTLGYYAHTSAAVEPDIIFDGTGTQTVTTNNNYTYFFAEDLTIGSTNNPTVVFTGTYPTRMGVYDGGVTINGSSLLNLGSNTIDQYNSGGTFTLAAGSTLKISGTEDFPLYTTKSLNATSNVYYNGTSQSITALTYGNLYLEGSGTKTLSSSITVNGSFTLGGTASLDANATIDFNGDVTIGSGTTFYGGSSLTHTVAGNWTNSGTFTCETSRITFDGSGSSTINTTSSSYYASSTIWTEGFENSGSMPSGWNKVAVTDNGIDPNITFITATSNPTGYSAYAGSYCASFNSYSSNSGGQMRLYQTSSYSTSGKTNLSLSFAWLKDNGYNTYDDYVTVQYSTNGSSWTSLSPSIYRYSSSNGWTTQTVSLPAGAENQSTLYIAFLFTSQYGNDCHLDNVALSSSTTESYSGEVFNNFTINKSGGAGVSLSSDILISSGITFTSGILTSTASNPIEFTESATASSTSNSSHVNGYIKKRTNSTTKFTFPCGSGTSYRSMAITPSSSSSTTWTAKYFNTGYGDYSLTGSNIHHVTKLEYWTLDRSGSANSTIELSWNASSEADANYTDLIVSHYNGSDWEFAGGASHSGNSSAGTLSSNSGWSSYSPFTLGSRTSNNPLPVNLVSFSALCNKKSVELNWTTASETNNQHYELERSLDGINYDYIENIKGMGNSSVQTYYTYTDHELPVNSAYYRIKQVDFDKKQQYYGPVFVECTNNTKPDLYVNNAENILMLSGLVLENGSASLQVYDLSGRLVYQDKLVGSNSTFQINLKGLNQGIYVVHLNTGNQTISKKFFL